MKGRDRYDMSEVDGKATLQLVWSGELDSGGVGQAQLVEPCEHGHEPDVA